MSQFVRISKSEAKRSAYSPQVTNLCIFVRVSFAPGFPWNVASLVFGKEYLLDAKEKLYRDGDDSHSGADVEKLAWDTLYNNWAYYNTSYETGYYAHYYIQTP